MTFGFLDVRTSRSHEIWNSLLAEVLGSWLLDLLGYVLFIFGDFGV